MKKRSVALVLGFIVFLFCLAITVDNVWAITGKDFKAYVRDLETVKFDLERTFPGATFRTNISNPTPAYIKHLSDLKKIYSLHKDEVNSFDNKLANMKNVETLNRIKIEQITKENIEIKKQISELKNKSAVPTKTESKVSPIPIKSPTEKKENYQSKSGINYGLAMIAIFSTVLSLILSFLYISKINKRNVSEDQNNGQIVIVGEKKNIEKEISDMEVKIKRMKEMISEKEEQNRKLQLEIVENGNIFKNELEAKYFELKEKDEIIGKSKKFYDGHEEMAKSMQLSLQMKNRTIVGKDSEIANLQNKITSMGIELEAARNALRISLEGEKPENIGKEQILERKIIPLQLPIKENYSQRATNGD